MQGGERRKERAVAKEARDRRNKGGKPALPRPRKRRETLETLETELRSVLYDSLIRQPITCARYTEHTHTHTILLTRHALHMTRKERTWGRSAVYGGERPSCEYNKI